MATMSVRSPFRVARLAARLRPSRPGSASRRRKVLLPAVLLLVTAAGIGLARWTVGPAVAPPPVEGPVTPAPQRVPETAPHLPSYAAVPRLALPVALAEARPAPIWPRSRPREGAGRMPTSRPEDAPVIALVIDDMGHNMETVRRAAALPAAMTLAFLPYVQDAPRRVAVAREAGKEIFLHMPMEPSSPAFDPGPGAIRAGQPAATIRANLEAALARVPGAVGVNNHMGSRATADARAMREVMGLLRERGLVYVDSWTSPRSVAEKTAREVGIPFGGRDVFIDNVREPAAIRRQLALAERRARRRGTAIVIGHPHAVTLEVLEEWIPEARARGVRFATLSAVVRRRRCPELRIAEPCGPREARAVMVRAAACGETGCRGEGFLRRRDRRN